MALTFASGEVFDGPPEIAMVPAVSLVQGAYFTATPFQRVSQLPH